MCHLAVDRSGPTRVAVLVVTRGAGAIGALLLRMRRLRPREVTNVAVATRGEMAGRDSNPDLRTWGFGGSVSAPELGVSSDASGEAGRQGRGVPAGEPRAGAAAHGRLGVQLWVAGRRGGKARCWAVCVPGGDAASLVREKTSHGTHDLLR